MYEISHFPLCFPWLWTCKANTTLVSCWVIFWICGIFPQVYSDYESNPQLRQAIEFACHQFYILHRKPFVLQLFASVAPLLEFPVSKLCANKERTNPMRKAHFVYSELTRAVDSWAGYYRLWLRVLFLWMAWSLSISVIRLSQLSFFNLWNANTPNHFSFNKKFVFLQHFSSSLISAPRV